ncbi:MAG: HAD-IB family phosphatase [Patescibacteria group bacterium]
MKRKINPRGYDIIIFDCDSTLSAVEGIDLLAEKHGIKDKVEELTHLAMNGHSNFADALALRLELVQPTREDLYWLGEEYIRKTTPGTKELISELHKIDKEIYIISGGFKDAIRIFAKHINIKESHVFSNVLFFDQEGKYTGFDKTNPLSKNHGKRITLKELAKMGNTLFVGDGITDLEAKDVVDLFVGFGGVQVRDAVKKEADIFIEEKTLKKIVNIASGSRMI